MGNSKIYPSQNYNNSLIKNTNKLNKKIYNTNLNYYRKNISPSFNNLTENEYIDNNNKYYYGFHQKSNKNKKKSQSNPKYRKTKSQNKIMNTIKNYTLFFINNNNIQSKNENMNINNLYKKQNYIKKYKNDDKFYRYGKKYNTIISNNASNLREKKKLYSTEIIKDKDKIQNLINENENNNNLIKNRKNKSFKNEKSSQFVLLNNSFNKNLFNAFQEVNNDKVNNNTINTIIGGNNNIFMTYDIRLTKINEPNINENYININDDSYDYDNNLNIDNLNITQNSTIKYKNYNYTQTSFIYNKPQLLLEQLEGYIDDDNEIKEDENKKTNDYNITNINNNSNIYSNKIIENKEYKYIGYIID